MDKLLSDIDISRSAPVASFLELEAAARSSFREGERKVKGVSLPDQNGSSSVQFHKIPASVFANRSATSKALLVASDYGSDNAYETSEVGTPRMGTEHNSEIGCEDLSADQDLSAAASLPTNYGIPNTDTGHFTEDSLLKEVDMFSSNKSKREVDVQRESLDGNASSELLSEVERNNGGGHARTKSTESIGSDVSSVRGSEFSNSMFPNSSSQLLDFSGLVESVMRILDNVQIALPLDQRNKMNRVLTTMERVIRKENEQKKHAKLSRKKLLHERKILRDRTQECSVNFLSEKEDKFTGAMDLLTTSDNRIGLLHVEAQLLAQDDESIVPSESRNDGNKFQGNAIMSNGEIQGATEEGVRKMLTDIFIENARLTMQANSVIRCALCSSVKLDNQASRRRHRPFHKNCIKQLFWKEDNDLDEILNGAIISRKRSYWRLFYPCFWRPD